MFLLRSSRFPFLFLHLLFSPFSRRLFLFTFPSLPVFASRFSRPDILLLRPSHPRPRSSLTRSLSIVALAAAAGFSFLFRRCGRSRRGATIYANILDNKSRRVIYEVSLSLFSPPANEQTPADRLPGVTPCSLKINNADGDRRCSGIFMTPRLRN